MDGDTLMNELEITAGEVSAGRLSNDHLAAARKAILEDGYVILNNAVSITSLDVLLEKMLEDARTLLDAGKWGGAGAVHGHLQQAPPPFAPYVFSDIIANPFAEQVSLSVLAGRAYLSLYTANTNTPGSHIQPLHRDTHDELWPGHRIIHPPFALVVNICPLEVTEGNGAIELWPGTHTLLGSTKGVAEQEASERREISPPIRGRTKKGSLLIRDRRLWHRGMPNLSDQIRPMVAVLHNIYWVKGDGPVRFRKGCEPAFSQSKLDPNVVFVDEPLEDYLFAPRQRMPV